MSIQIVSDDGVIWTGPDTVTIRGTEYVVEFAPDGCGGPCLYLVLPLGSPVYFRATLEDCGCNWATFAVGDPFVCGGATAPGGPCKNRVTIRVEWKCCNPIEGWGGPGWYCIKPAGRVAGCRVAELLGNAACDRTIEICSGPYVDEAAAESVCSLYVECGDRRFARYYSFTMGDDVTGLNCADADCETMRGRVNLVQFATFGGMCPWSGVLNADYPSDCFGGSGLLAWNFRTVTGPTFQIELILTIGGADARWVSSDLDWQGDTPLVLTGGSVVGPFKRCGTYPTTVTMYPEL